MTASNDLVFWGVIGCLVFSVVVLLYIWKMAWEKINTDHSED